MTTRSYKRPWLAVLLAFLYPGLGHIYLREWLRALVWFFLVVTSSTLLIDESAFPQALSVEAFVSAAEKIPPGAAIVIVSITFFSMVDAYWVARQRNEQTASPDTTSCPHCGKDVDPDLDFCHWCTEQITPEGEPE